MEFYPEDLLVPFAAHRLGRPVKWIEDRQEHFQSTVHARQQVPDIELALRRDGTILGLRDRILTDMGAYVRALGFINPSLSSSSVPGPYRIPHVRIDSVAVLTNKTPVSPYRGAGQPEATFARERLLDIAAQQLGLDPAELRRRSLLPPQAMPYEVGLAYDAQGQLVASTLMDYALPGARDVPQVEIIHLETPTPLNPLGVKGLGEGGAIASHAAVANAVADALTPLGVRITQTPLRGPTIRELIQQAAG